MLPDPVDYWHWLALGALIAAVEILAPGVFFLWIGIAAVVTGLILLVLPMLPFSIQLLLFAVLSVASVYGGRRFFRVNETESDHPRLNRRAQRLIGQRFTLDEPTVDGRGRVRVGDGWWRVVSAEGDLAAGTTIRVAAVEGTTLQVRAAD